MPLPWYEWQPVRTRLFTFGRALQGASPYRIVLETDKTKCPSGFIHFSKRLVMVNPTMFDVNARRQYSLTKAILCHEAGHRRFTTPSSLPPHVHLVSNILEDERIERLMEGEFAGVRSLLKELSRELLKAAHPLDPKSDAPAEVLGYLLQRRFAERSGETIKGSLSSTNEERWNHIASLVEDAWTAESSTICDRNAAEIVKVLGVTEPDIPPWLRELVETFEKTQGERTPSDPAETAAPSDPLPEDDKEAMPFDGEPLPHEHGVGSVTHRIEPKPYRDVVENVQPLVQRLVEELRVEHALSLPEPSARGGRLSVRDYRRDPAYPFLLPYEERPVSPTLTFRVIIDHSASMNFGERILFAAQAAMVLHLAGVELTIPHQIIVAPDDLCIADLESGEIGLARIAGIIPAQTGHEDTGRAVFRHGTELRERPENLKLLLVLHDGMGNDHELLAKACKQLHDRVLILGIGIGMGETQAALLREQFGADRSIHCAMPEELPQKVGAVLRTVRGR